MFILYMIIVCTVASYISSCGGGDYPSKDGKKREARKRPESTKADTLVNSVSSPNNSTSKPATYFQANFYTENGRVFIPCNIMIALTDSTISFNDKVLYVKDKRMYTESTIDHTITSVPISVRNDEFHVGNIVYLTYLKEIKQAKTRLKEKKSNNNAKNTQSSSNDKTNVHVTYTIEPKDTWMSVAKKFNTTTYNLMRRNPSVKELQIGGKLTIN